MGNKKRSLKVNSLSSSTCLDSSPIFINIAVDVTISKRICKNLKICINFLEKHVHVHMNTLTLESLTQIYIEPTALTLLEKS